MAKSDLTLSWDAMWSYLDEQGDSYYKAFFQENDVPELISSMSADIQAEMLQKAPMWVKKWAKSILKPEARLVLLGEREKSVPVRDYQVEVVII